LAILDPAEIVRNHMSLDLEVCRKVLQRRDHLTHNRILAGCQSRDLEEWRGYHDRDNQKKTKRSCRVYLERINMI
jgi:hypothetical protein